MMSDSEKKKQTPNSIIINIKKNKRRKSKLNYVKQESFNCLGLFFWKAWIWINVLLQNIIVFGAARDIYIESRCFRGQLNNQIR